MIFLNSAISAAALMFYLPVVCTHTDTEGKVRVRNILKSSEKTQYLMNTLYMSMPNVYSGFLDAEHLYDRHLPPHLIVLTYADSVSSVTPL